MRGQIDVVTKEGRAEGWCWDPLYPDSKVKFSILVDGVHSSSGEAGIFRQDLLDADVGDGAHGFSVLLPKFTEVDKRKRTLSIQEIDTGIDIGPPFVLIDNDIVDIDDRLSDIEGKHQLLAETLANLTQTTSRAAAADLFSMVSVFFSQAAKEMAAGASPTAYRSLETAVRIGTAAHPRLTWPVAPAPVATIIVLASAPLEHVYEAIGALLRASTSIPATLVVIDDGAFDDVILIASIVRNINYVRADDDQVVEVNRVVAAASGDLVVLLDGAAIVGGNWIDEARATLSAIPRLAAVGGMVRDAQGHPRHGGLCLREDGRLLDTIADRPASQHVLDAVEPVHALSHRAMVLRRDAVRQGGGLDLAYGNDLGTAVVDLCLRLREAGWMVASLPFGDVQLRRSRGEAPWKPVGAMMPGHARDLLRTRFGLAAAEPALTVGRAMALDFDATDGASLLPAVQALVQGGYAVHCVTNGSLDPAAAATLRRSGAILSSIADDESLGELIAAADIELLYIPAAPLDAAAGTVPDAVKRVVGLDELHALLAAPEEARPHE